MKNIFFGFISALLLLASCKPIDERDSMGALLAPSDIKLTAVNTTPGGNQVVITNNTVGAGGVWDYLIGTSFRKCDTVILPFKGNITIPFTATTAGGLVQASTTVTITVMDHPVEPEWALLAGTTEAGKTWVWADGSHLIGYDGVSSVLYGNGGADDLSPAWWKATKSDAIGAGTYNDEMTFDLNGKANMTLVDKDKDVDGNVLATPKTTTGKFILKVKATDKNPAKSVIGTLDLIDRFPLALRINKTSDYPHPYLFQIVKLTENEMWLKNTANDGNSIMYCLKTKGYVYPSK